MAILGARDQNIGNYVAVEARKLEFDHAPTPNQTKKDNQHRSS